MTSKRDTGITTEQFRAALEQLALQRESKKKTKQQAADMVTLELARERIRRNDERQGI